MGARRGSSGNVVPNRWQRALQSYPARQLPSLAARQAREVVRRKLRSADPVYLDLTGRVADPIEAIYLSEGATPIVEVPLERLRWSDLGLRLVSVENPFVRTATQQLSGEVRDYARSALRRQYERWCPADAGEALGLVASGSTGLLAAPESAVLPWKAMAGRAHGIADISGRDAHLGDKWHGAKKFFGPVTEEFGEAEFGRYQRVAASIAAYGFVAELGGYIRVSILAAGREWVAQMYAGAHRLAAVAALDLDPVTVAVHGRPMLVRREDASSWPGVRSGLFSEAQALAVFDRVLAGEPPLGYREAVLDG
jgi:hypothetical protein